MERFYEIKKKGEKRRNVLLKGLREGEGEMKEGMKRMIRNGSGHRGSDQGRGSKKGRQKKEKKREYDFKGE